MNIYTVRDNLVDTIAGKEALLKKSLAAQSDIKLHAPSTGGYSREKLSGAALSSVIEYLEINIDELKRILADVEVCCEKATQDSWTTNPDRSGGQFTQDEIYNNDRSGWIEP